jgi:hypothetical protein
MMQHVVAVGFQATRPDDEVFTFIFFLLGRREKGGLLDAVVSAPTARERMRAETS